MTTNAQEPAPPDSIAQATTLEMQHAIETAAQCWCDPRTSHLQMNVDLAMVFAERLASELAAQAKTIAGLREALSPFADFAKALHKSMPDEAPITQGSAFAYKQITVRDFRKAAAAFGPTPPAAGGS